MKLISEVRRDIKVLKESVGSGQDYYIEGIFAQSETPNKNNRVYPREILMREVERFRTECIDENRALGELGHPEGPGINLERVSHRIIELRDEGKNVFGKAKIMDTPYGKIVKNLIDEGVKLGVSTRGLGSLRKSGDLYEVQDDFYLATVDIVADPSAPEAFVNGIMEGKEWVFENGVIKALEIEKYKKEIQRTTMSKLEEKALDCFKDFFSKIK